MKMLVVILKYNFLQTYLQLYIQKKTPCKRSYKKNNNTLFEILTKSYSNTHISRDKSFAKPNSLVFISKLKRG